MHPFIQELDYTCIVCDAGTPVSLVDKIPRRKDKISWSYSAYVSGRNIISKFKKKKCFHEKHLKMKGSNQNCDLHTVISWNVVSERIASTDVISQEDGPCVSRKRGHVIKYSESEVLV